MLPEHCVSPGQVLHITAQHDTYAITFDLQTSACAAATAPATPTASVGSPSSNSPASAEAAPGSPQPTGVPLFDPLWRHAYEQVGQLQAGLAKAMSQDPLEYRRLVSAATLLPTRPWGGGSASASGSDGSSSTGVEEARGSAPAPAKCDDKQQQQQQLRQTVTWPPADPHHASALLVRLMT